MAIEPEKNNGLRSDATRSLNNETVGVNTKGNTADIALAGTQRRYQKEAKKQGA